MAEARQVHADLVRAPSPDFYFQQRELRSAIHLPAKAAQDAILRPGGAAIGQSGSHTDAADRVARDWLFHPPAIVLHAPMHECEVDLFDLAAGKLCRQDLMG